ncbi:hypothetical protein [Marivita sp.]|uniref:hypothetical protein n=1 Tax=Marivita sp. TaxID=2003365 RepID=UPI0025BE0C7E|nr:hypothetical protein [Marivita sp.]
MEILLIIGIIIALAGGVLSGVVASAKNRDPLVWGITGALFPLLGLIAIAGMPMAQTMQVLSPTKQNDHVEEGVIEASEENKKEGILWLGFLIFILFVLTLTILWFGLKQ